MFLWDIFDFWYESKNPRRHCSAQLELLLLWELLSLFYFIFFSCYEGFGLSGFEFAFPAQQCPWKVVDLLKLGTVNICLFCSCTRMYKPLFTVLMHKLVGVWVFLLYILAHSVSWIIYFFMICCGIPIKFAYSVGWHAGFVILVFNFQVFHFATCLKNILHLDFKNFELHSWYVQVQKEIVGLGSSNCKFYWFCAFGTKIFVGQLQYKRIMLELWVLE